MRISDWSSDVCSSDLPADPIRVAPDPLQRGRRGEGKRRRPFPAARKSVRGAVMRSLDDIFEDYDFLDGDDRYRLLIDLGRELEPMPGALKTDATLVRGCSASVWVYPVPQADGRLHFLAEDRKSTRLNSSH